MFIEPLAGRTKTLRFNRDHGGQSGRGGIPNHQRLGNRQDPEFYISQYDGEIRFFDESFGKLTQKIQELGLFSNSLIIFTADHGEGMGEHEYYFAHHEFLYNGLIHVPLIIRLPGQSSEAKEIRYPVGHVDLLPTVLDAVSITLSQPFQGRNLLPRGKERDIFSETHGMARRYALIRNDMKLIQSKEGYELKGYELYDLRKDFAETVNLMDADMTPTVATTVADLKRGLEAIRQQDSLALGKPVPWPSDQQIRRVLRSLGYVQ